MAVVVAIAITAIIVAAAASHFTAQSVRAAVTKAIGGRDGVDPIDEHRRLLAHAKRETGDALTRADLLQLSLDALTSGVIVCDHVGRVLVRNRLAGDVSARAHEQTLVNATAAELLSAAIQGRAGDRELEVFGPPRRVLFVHAAPVNSGAQTVGALAVIDDVTDHHRIEKTRRDFVANLSHELRTPVGAASLLAEMIADERDPDTLAQLSSRLLIETDRMAATIDDLLELSRIESETERFDESFIVQKVIAEAVERLRVSADAGGITIGVVAPVDPLNMVGNRDQLLVALVNLIENAIKYSSPGDSVSVRARIDDDTLALVVQDTGRGIPPRDIDRIFERFYRVDRSRDATSGGTGIGLAIVRHVAMNHGGSVGVESFEGDGSTFTMSLPIVAPQAIAESESVGGAG